MTRNLIKANLFLYFIHFNQEICCIGLFLLGGRTALVYKQVETCHFFLLNYRQFYLFIYLNKKRS